MDSKLEQLLAEKRELERQISLLKKNAQMYGCAKIDKQHYPTNKADEWFVSIFQEETRDRNGKVIGRWRSIIRNPDKQTVLDNIDIVINDLQILKEKVLKEEQK